MTVFYVEACIADKGHVLLRADVVGSSRKFKDMFLRSIVMRLGRQPEVSSFESDHQPCYMLWLDEVVGKLGSSAHACLSR
jgi:hypothetical protein